MSEQSTLFAETSYCGAVFDDTETYRYLLWRRWSEGAPLLWIMLNPSTADATKLDTTLRRCIDYTKRWGYPAMEIGNAYAYAGDDSTDPRSLWKLADPVGPDNMRHLAEAVARASKVIVGWGNNAKADHARSVYDLIVKGGKVPYALIVNEKTGSPGHPLYLRKDLLPIPWSPRA